MVTSTPAPQAAAREPTLYELLGRLALAASPRQLELAGAAQIAAAAAVWWLARDWWICAMPMAVFASTCAWGLAAQAERELGPALRLHPGRRAALAATKAVAAAAGTAAGVVGVLGFFLLALGTSWMS